MGVHVKTTPTISSKNDHAVIILVCLDCLSGFYKKEDFEFWTLIVKEASKQAIRRKFELP